MAPAREEKKMFRNLIESDSHRKDYSRRGSFFLGTLAVYAGLFMALTIGSIYAYNIQFEDQDLELVSLIAPIEPEREQIPRAPTSRRVQAAAGSSGNTKPMVVKSAPVISVMDPTRAPGKVSIAPPVPELPPGMKYRIGIPKEGDNIFGGGDGKNSAGGFGGGDNSGGGGGGLDELARQAPPPPALAKEIVKPPTNRTVVSAGVVNGKASSLPRPVYSVIAKNARAYGVVTVQVLIDETGKVVSARVVSGHPLLQRESVQAAYQARFTPTLLSGQPVRVSGVITYNFVLQ
jgi:protein TonB